jgi:hypothetical protein
MTSTPILGKTGMHCGCGISISGKCELDGLMALLAQWGELGWCTDGAGRHYCPDCAGMVRKGERPAWMTVPVMAEPVQARLAL